MTRDARMARLSASERDELLEELLDESLPVEQRQNAANRLALHRQLPPELDEVAAALFPEVPAEEGPAGNAGTGVSVLNTVQMSKVKAEPIEWLWEGRLPMRKVSMVLGDPGIGKSHMTIALTATITSGGCWPDHPGKPVPKGKVLIFAAEDDLADTVRPRLERAEADLDLVHAVESVKLPSGRLSAFSLRRDVETLDRKLKELKDVRLVIIDPVASFMGAGINQNQSGETREALDPITRLAQRHRVAVLMVNHLNKSSGTGNALYRGLGSISFIGNPRAVWYVSEHPFDPTRCLFSWMKSNCGPKVTALSYRLPEGRFEWDADPVPLYAKDVLRLIGREERAARGEGDGKRGFVAQKAKAVADFFRCRLPNAGKLNKETLLNEAVEKLGVSRTTAQRGLERLNGNIQELSVDGGQKLVLWVPDLGLRGDHSASS